MIFEKTLQLSTCEQPHQIADRTAQERQEERYFEHIPVTVCIRKRIGGQCRRAENHDLGIGQLHEEPGQKIAVFPGFRLPGTVAAKYMPCQPQYIRSSDPGQHVQPLVERHSYEPDDYGDRHGDDRESGEDPSPLTQRLFSSVGNG